MSSWLVAYLVLPGVQIHDQILRLRVTVPHLALVAVLVRGHLVRVEGQIGRLVAGLGGHRYLREERRKNILINSK